MKPAGNRPPLAGWIDLSERAKFRLTGPDRVRYLNGQVTRNIAALRPGDAVPALVCTAKGRLEAEVVVRAEAECLLVDAPSELRTSLLARLEKYLIADDCVWEDVTDAFSLWHGPGPEEPGRVDRFGPPGRDVWQPAGTAGPDGPRLDPEAVDLIRLAWGVPVWGAELTADTLPQEARLEDRAVDFHKGCYVGQEVVSRLRSVGRVNRLLCRLEADGGQSLAAGDRLFLAPASPGDEPAEVGTVTSVRRDPARGMILALGYLKRAAIIPGAVFQAGSGKNALSSVVKCGEITPASV